MTFSPSACIALQQTKFKWGSRPQYGDWGISQPASARTLRRLAGRLMAFAGRATGGRFNMGTPVSSSRSAQYYVYQKALALELRDLVRHRNACMFTAMPPYFRILCTNRIANNPLVPMALPRKRRNGRPIPQPLRRPTRRPWRMCVRLATVQCHHGLVLFAHPSVSGILLVLCWSEESLGPLR